jgi:c-di-GMP-binding flagellar brake protein YcgR
MHVVERRRVPRHSFETKVEIEWGSEVLTLVTADLSLGGMFLRHANPLWVGAAFRARLLWPEKYGDPLEVECVVRRVAPGRGMGVEFQKLSETARERIASLLEGVSTA